ncbi:MAG TPA: helix-turn-helix domain-containing protein [Rhodanobacter sp.]|nr:helix-turn-helix domain-containing protein [Rhodanobacter sp.]
MIDARTERLKTLMAAHKLTPAQVGDMLARSPQTVRCWRCQWESRVIPEHTLAVLEMKISAQMVHA